ncbi:MAG: Exodeoxyribonuclease V beta chain, partial [uncultured Frankineae bacterium]
RCRAARPSARWCTRCSRSSTRPPRTWPPSCCCAAGRRSVRGWRPSTPRRCPRRCCPCCAPRSPTVRTWRASRRPTGSPSSPSSSRCRAVTARRSGRPAWARSPRCCARTCRPTTCWRRTRTSWSGWTHRPCGATSPGASTRCCGCPGRATSSSTTRPTASRRASSRRRTTPVRRWRPRCCAPTTRCRRCSTPSRCTASCAGVSRATTPSATSAACSTCSCAAWWVRRHRRGAASSTGGRRLRSSSPCPTCWRGR